MKPGNFLLNFIQGKMIRVTELKEHERWSEPKLGVIHWIGHFEKDDFHFHILTPNDGTIVYKVSEIEDYELIDWPGDGK